MKARKAQVTRETGETEIAVTLNVDGTGQREIETWVGFFDHMLDLFAKHGLFDLQVRVPKADLQIDEHHTVEDIGITLGQAFAQALGDKVGIRRYGFFILPMDETLVQVAVDLGGRAWFELKDGKNEDMTFSREKVGDLSTELVYDILEAFASNLCANIHVKVEYGRNAHHMIEGIFKCLARALRMACELDERASEQVPSTKGQEILKQGKGERV
ncbi:MAG TPA: imidazoleglycerol-phosphate dehydratase HisB [bacterium]|nr:imidazoleglycerol-phosphate dehydratase HisB [bacterium]